MVTPVLWWWKKSNSPSTKEGRNLDPGRFVFVAGRGIMPSLYARPSTAAYQNNHMVCENRKTHMNMACPGLFCCASHHQWKLLNMDSRPCMCPNL